MSGFDKSKFLSLSNDIENELKCGICLNILNNPMTTPCCRHSYCRQCILQSLQMSSNPNTCPNDRKKLLSKDLIKGPRIVTNILENQKVYCDFKSYGCPQTGRLGQLSKHLIKCMFDPNKSTDRCTEALKSMSETVDILRNKIRRQEFDHLDLDHQVLEKQLDVCQREVKLMTSDITPKIVRIQPNTDEFMKEVIESAKNNIESPEIISEDIEIENIKEKVMEKCKEAILKSDDYRQIGLFLVESLNDDENEWTAFVYPKNSAQHSVSSYSYRIELCFGELCIFLMGRDNADNWDDYEDEDVEDNNDEDNVHIFFRYLIKVLYSISLEYRRDRNELAYYC